MSVTCIAALLGPSLYQELMTLGGAKKRPAKTLIRPRLARRMIDSRLPIRGHRKLPDATRVYRREQKWRRRRRPTSKYLMRQTMRYLYLGPSGGRQSAAQSTVS